jgi:ABC-2 type transport system permease protein
VTAAGGVDLIASTTTETARVGRPGAVRLLVGQVNYEQRSFWRNRVRGFFTVAFPVMFLVIFASINGGTRLKSVGNISYVQFFVPGILAFGLISTTFTNIAVDTALLRDEGVLKRVRGTPVPTWAYMGGRILSAIATMLVLLTVMIVIGWVGYGVHLRWATVPGLILAVVVGAACFTALGLAITIVIPNADAAPAVVNFIFFPLSFASGIWFPVQSTQWLNDLGGVFPIRALADSLQAAYSPGAAVPGVVGHDLMVMGLWFFGGLFVIRRWFRWESSKP